MVVEEIAKFHQTKAKSLQAAFFERWPNNAQKS